jgi:arylsulfatase A-like enzyme
MSTHSFESVISRTPDYRCYIDLWLSLAIAALPIVLKGLVFLFYDDSPIKVLPSVLASIGDTPRLLLALLLFALTMLTLHMLTGYLAWRVWRPFAQALNYPVGQRYLLGSLFFTVLQGAILGLNSLLFPNSSLQVAIPVFLVALGSGSLLGVLVWHVKRSIVLFKLWQWHLGYVVLSLVSLVLGSFLIDSEAGHVGQVQRDNPDIIIIGLDSFRPDHLKQADDKASITPNLDQFLNDAYRFERTYTPMARTYPAWMSILTGRYPIEHGARFNLLDFRYLKDHERSLPFLLKAKGYTTAYSIDETRFSNIDKRYGFDITVTPEIGAADFLLSSAADVPLSNLLNLAPSLHAALFPYQFMNRAVHKTYEPANFDEELAHLADTADPKRPLFLVTHFELPHWPFDWRDSANHIAPENPRLMSLSPPHYQKAVHRADSQFAALIDSLKRNGRLNNAIVVVLSDHGEGFSDFTPVWQATQNTKPLSLPLFALHGVNVLDEAQTRVLLAFKTFGKGRLTQQGLNRRLTSLIDVAPTILGLAAMDKQELNASGCDLFAIQDSRTDCQQDRVIFTESGFYVPSLVQNNALDQNKIAEEAYAYYDVNLNTRLTLKDDFLQQLLDNKQRAAISEQGIAASIPLNGAKQFLLGNLAQRTYRNAEGKARTTVENELMRKLCRRYAMDDASLNSFCRKLS